MLLQLPYLEELAISCVDKRILQVFVTYLSHLHASGARCLFPQAWHRKISVIFGGTAQYIREKDERGRSRRRKFQADEIVLRKNFPKICSLGLVRLLVRLDGFGFAVTQIDSREVELNRSNAKKFIEIISNLKHLRVLYVCSLHKELYNWKSFRHCKVVHE